VIYELTGMSGLGLAPEKIRVIARSPHLYDVIVQHGVQFILPAACFLVLLLILALGLRKRPADAPAGIAGGMAAVLGITSLVFIIAGICIQKALWARHCAPVFPFYVALLGLAIAGVLKTRGFYVRFLPWMLLGPLLFSSLNLRFAAQYRKEDNRTAAQFARHALDENKTVLWVSGRGLAQYYNLEGAASGSEAKRFFNCGEDQIESILMPDVIILSNSKLDLYDPHAIIQNFIKQNGYKSSEQLRSFVIWTR
jgi:hypothetical protein